MSDTGAIDIDTQPFQLGVWRVRYWHKADILRANTDVC